VEKELGIGGVFLEGEEEDDFEEDDEEDLDDFGEAVLEADLLEELEENEEDEADDEDEEEADGLLETRDDGVGEGDRDDTMDEGYWCLKFVVGLVGFIVRRRHYCRSKSAK
jgi:hypothetical protein